MVEGGDTCQFDRCCSIPLTDARTLVRSHVVQAFDHQAFSDSIPPWGFGWDRFLWVWQCIITVCIAVTFWVQLFMNQSRQWISLFCGRVGGYQGCLLKHARVHSQVDDLPLLEIQKKIFGGGSYHRHLLALVLMCTLHSGEATNPGPSRPAEWTLGVCNPSGLNGKQQILNDHLGFGDTWLMTETHLSSGAMQSFKAGLHITDSPYKYCVGGHPCPLRPHSDHAGAWTGVSVLSKHPTRAIPVKVDPDLFKSSRIQFTDRKSVV